jgi:hypothetical protein
MLKIDAETLKGKINYCIKSILRIILFLAHVCFESSEYIFGVDYCIMKGTLLLSMMITRY